MEKEIWKEIPNTDSRYAVSSLGRVRSNDFIVTRKNGSKAMHKGRILSQEEINSGYMIVSLSVNGHHFNRLVHRLVAQAFCDNYSEDLDIDHVDCNKKNNRADNLECVTRHENLLRAYRNHLAYETENKHIAHVRHGQYIREKYSMPIAMYTKDGKELLETFESLSEARKQRGVHITCITNAANHDTISYGHEWKWIKKRNDYSDEEVG